MIGSARQILPASSGMKHSQKHRDLINSIDLSDRWPTDPSKLSGAEMSSAVNELGGYSCYQTHTEVCIDDSAVSEAVEVTKKKQFCLVTLRNVP